MYSPLIDSFTPTAIITTALNYVVWTHYNADRNVQKIFNNMCWLNVGVATTLFCVEYLQPRNNTVMVSKEDRTKKIVLHALAIGLLGAVVSHWRFTCLSNSLT